MSPNQVITVFKIEDLNIYAVFGSIEGGPRVLGPRSVCVAVKYLSTRRTEAANGRVEDQSGGGGWGRWWLRTTTGPDPLGFTRGGGGRGRTEGCRPLVPDSWGPGPIRGTAPVCQP